MKVKKDYSKQLCFHTLKREKNNEKTKSSTEKKRAYLPSPLYNQHNLFLFFFSKNIINRCSFFCLISPVKYFSKGRYSAQNGQVKKTLLAVIQ